MIEFISYQQFPEDSYTKELVYLQIDGKYRIAYISRLGKNGNIFWAPIQVGITKNGKKEYFLAIEFDSAFLKRDIETFLASRPWEKKIKSVPSQKQMPPDNYIEEDLPF